MAERTHVHGRARKDEPPLSRGRQGRRVLGLLSTAAHLLAVQPLNPISDLGTPTAERVLVGAELRLSQTPLGTWSHPQA